MKTWFLLFSIILILVIGAQAQSSRTVRKNMLVSTQWLAANLKDPKLVLVHVGRDRKIYEAGHVPGARFLLYSDIVMTRNGIFNELPPVEKLQQVFSQVGIADDSRIVLLCDVSGLLAARTYFTLDYLGSGERTSLLDGGLEKWKAEDREINQIVPEIHPATFTPQLHPEIIVSKEAVHDVSFLATTTHSTNTVLIDARPADVYDGTKTNPDLPINGHIPGAGNMYWMQNLVSKESPTLKPITELQKLYENAGAVSGKKVITYCWIGMMASHDYFTLKYLGYDVAMYDGSFTEWAKTEGAQAVKGPQPK